MLQPLLTCTCCFVIMLCAGTDPLPSSESLSLGLRHPQGSSWTVGTSSLLLLSLAFLRAALFLAPFGEHHAVQKLKLQVIGSYEMLHVAFCDAGFMLLAAGDDELPEGIAAAKLASRGINDVETVDLAYFGALAVLDLADNRVGRGVA